MLGCLRSPASVSSWKGALGGRRWCRASCCAGRCSHGIERVEPREAGRRRRRSLWGSDRCGGRLSRRAERRRRWIDRRRKRFTIGRWRRDGDRTGRCVAHREGFALLKLSRPIGEHTRTLGIDAFEQPGGRHRTAAHVKPVTTSTIIERRRWVIDECASAEALPSPNPTSPRIDAGN